MKIKRIATLGLATLLSSSFFVACTDTPNVSGLVDVKVKLWSAPTTQKIMRDREYLGYTDCVLEYDMAKNEIEGAQVIITPTDDYKVRSFDVSVGDLKNANGAVISKDDVKVYFTKIPKASSGAF